ncbi:MAG TPA: twin-arginine translocase subunit TatC [Candidatus Margulisiibacteriota bacterium]|nr:twin-arginine translocase subunit TatC [Candidatus Margulisiibacteriota bacterium]
MSADLKMPLTAHLEELRWRLIKALSAIGVAFFGCYAFAERLFDILTRPLLALNVAHGTDSDVVHLIGTGVVEAFFTKLKVSFIAAIFLASPMILYQIWQFVAPGLYDTEKRYARPFVFFGTFFFVCGAWFCYALVLPVGYQFFIEQYGSIRVSPEIRISEYLSFTARMLLAFGATFEMPVITFFLARLGVVTHTAMLHYTRYAILVIVIVAAMLTPGPDVASQLLMAGPLLVLYGLSIGVAYVFGKPREPTSSES